MNKQAIFSVFSLIGLISSFLPFSRSTVIGCGLDGGGSVDYIYDPLVKYFFDFFTLPSISFLHVFEFLAIILVFFSIVFTPILLFFNKKHTSLIFIILTLVLMLISIYNSFDTLAYGYYIIILQQILLLIIISKNNNKSQFIFP